MSPKSLSNLKPFRKGPDPRRNTKGPGKRLPELDSLMDDIFGVDGVKGKGRIRTIFEALHRKAAKGNIRAIEIILDRCYGKPRQAMDLEVQFEGNTDLIARALAAFADLPRDEQLRLYAQSKNGQGKQRT